MINLPNVTLICLSNYRIKESIFALEYSMSLVNFAESVFVTNNELIKHSGINIIQNKLLNNRDDYSTIVLFDLYKYVDTDFCLIIQHDGFIVNPTMWTDEFLSYDYVGAPWYDNIVGNGGFSLRSKKMIEAFKKENLERHNIDYPYGYPEDDFICRRNNPYLEKIGLKMAPVNLALRFSREPFDFNWQKEHFGFHYGNFFDYLQIKL